LPARETVEPLGCAGLLPAATAAQYDASLAGAIEPLAASVPSAWGHGYATESLQALIQYAFDALDLEALAAVVEAPNDASHRLVSRLGFVSTGECPGPLHRLRTYVLTRDRQRTWEPATR
jgi:RimJ/RimL family protein N-acetyltransferase